MKTKTLLMYLGAILLSATLMICLSPQNSKALTLELNGVLSGYGPQTTAPWLTATFTDVADGVQLTLSGSGLTGEEFIQGNINDKDSTKGQFGWGFNFNPDKEASIASLAFTAVSGTLAVGIQKAADAFKAGGDGYFDILFAWDNKNRFESGDTAVYLISMAGLVAADFDFLSEGGSNGYSSAAHIQGISIAGVTEDGSGWVAVVPEPATIFLMGSGLLGAGIFLRRKCLQNTKK